LAADTWVQASGAPKGVGGAAYATALAGGGQGSTGARLFVAGRTDDGFAYLHYDASGDRDTSVVELARVNPLGQANPLPASPVMVGDHAGTYVAVALSNGGTPEAPEQSTVALLDSGNGGPVGVFSLPGQDPVASMAFGLTSVASSGPRGLVVAREGLVSIIADT